MTRTTLPIDEIQVIAATRFLFGAGIALLLGQRLTSRQRHWMGWTLVALGALSTPPLIYDIYCRRADG